MQKVCLVNGSPRGQPATSRVFLQGLERVLAREGIRTAWVSVGRRAEEPTPAGALEQLVSSDAIVFSLPLYAYSIPAALTKLLEELCRRLAHLPPRARRSRVYALVNSAYADPAVNEEALRVMRLFCRQAGLSWRFGVSIGGGMVVAKTQAIPSVGWALRRLYRRIRADLSSGGAPPGQDLALRPIIPKVILDRLKDSTWARRFTTRQPQDSS